MPRRVNDAIDRFVPRERYDQAVNRAEDRARARGSEDRLAGSVISVPRLVSRDHRRFEADKILVAPTYKIGSLGVVLVLASNATYPMPCASLRYRYGVTAISAATFYPLDVRLLLSRAGHEHTHPLFV